MTLADGAGSAAGTGMVISSSGEVLTNNHVVDGAQSISVQVAGTGPTYSAHVLGYDVTADVALIKVDGAPSLTTVNLGDSSTVSVGDAVTAVGNALGRSGPPSVTTGSVTALDQQITASDQGGANAETLNGLIQIDALIQPGDSGGPLVNAANQVVGMDTAAASSGRFRIRQQGSRVAFAIPINAALTIAHEIEAGGGGDSAVQTGDRAFLGVGTQDGNGDGAQVTSVQQGSPADDAGLAAGDVITGLDGTTVDSPTTLRSAILRHHPGDRVGVTWRDGSGNQHTATVTLTSGPPA
ncbi:MAG: PDZ domain-containing protein [Chloroflexi bacterium]|nr:MAG: PDZ domain-containing protein [Chloroflexota bacterium]